MINMYKITHTIGALIRDIGQENVKMRVERK
jgi:hypothetical protein